MKKIITMIVVIAMIATLAMTCVNAADGHYVWNHTGEYVEDAFSDTTRVGHDSPQTTTIKFNTDVSFSKILFPKVWSTPHCVFTLKLYKGNTVVFEGTSAELYNEPTKSGDVNDVEIDFGKKIAAGEYTMELSVPEGYYAFFAYGNGQLPDSYFEYERGHAMFGLYTTDNGKGFVDLGVVLAEKTVSVYEETQGGDPFTLQNGEVAIVVTVPAGYKLSQVIGSNSPTWSNTEGGSDAKAEVYKWAGSYEDTVAGAVLASAEIKDHKDNSDAVFALNKELPSGDYLVVFTATGDKNIGFWTSSAVTGEHKVFVQGTESTTCYPKVKMKLLADDSQADSPDTGDAAIVATAVLAIAAMGVTVVLVKKKVR